MTSLSQTNAAPLSDASGGRLAAAGLAALFGLALVFLAGFAPAVSLHNAAHDFRHAQNFPCH